MSDTGKVFHDGKEIAAHPRGNLTKVNDSRYMAVNISIYDENGKFAKQTKHYVHRLVAEAFIPNPENLSDVDHIDCVKLKRRATWRGTYAQTQKLLYNGG